MREFDPNKHCGARRHKDGRPCKLLKGFKTNHPGVGRCRYHGGRSTGAKTEKGKEMASKNSIKHDLYGKHLRGKDKKRYEEIKDVDNSSLLHNNFLYVQAKILGLIQGDVKLKGFFEKIVSIAEVLVSEGEATEEDVILLKQLLANVDLEKLTRIMVSSSNLARTAHQFSEEGDIATENKLLRSYLIKTVQVGNLEVKQLASQYFVLLQKEAGIPTKTIKSLIGQSLSKPEEILEN